MNVRLRLLRIPTAAARGAERLFRMMAPMLPGNRFKAVSFSAVDFMSRDNPFSSDRAKRELGWAPPVKPETGVPEAFRWYAANAE